MCYATKLKVGLGREGSLKELLTAPAPRELTRRIVLLLFSVYVLIKESREQFTVSLLCSLKPSMTNIRYEIVCSNRIDRCAILGYLVTSG